MGPATQPAELQFAQRLASHEKGVRDRAVRKLRQYISAKTQRETGGFTQEELLKIWKGLFYCMWVQDEPLLQEELAVTMSQLVHAVNNSEAQHLLIRTFWQTMNREWTEIDRPRLDKCHRLIRLTVRQSFEVLKRNGWEDSRIQPLLDILMKEVLHPESRAPDGVKGHLIAVYLQELSKVGGGELLADQNLKLIDPFCKIAAKTKDHTLVQAIARSVFEAIAPLDASTRDPSEGPACERPPATAAGKGPPRAAEDRGDGGSEAPGPLLQFDYKAVAARLLEMTSRKNTPPFNRKRLCRLAEKFQHLSEGEAIAAVDRAPATLQEPRAAAPRPGRGEEGAAGLQAEGSAGGSVLTVPEGKTPRRTEVTPAGSVGPASLAGDGPVSGDDPALRGRQQTDRAEERLGTGSGNAGGSASPASEEEPSRGPQRRKRKRRRRKSVQPEQPTAGSGASALPKVRAGEPPAGREVPLRNGAEPPSTAPAGAQKRRLGEPPPGRVKRRRLRKKGPRAVGEQSGPPDDTPQGQDSQGSKRKQKLSILPASITCTAPQPCPAGSDSQRPPLQGVSDSQRPSPQGVGDAQRPLPQGDGDAQRPPPQGDCGVQRPPPQGDCSVQRPPPQGVGDAQRPPPQGDCGVQRPPPQGDCGVQRPPPQRGKMKRRKKGEQGALSLHGLSCPRPTSLAKRKRVMATASAWPHAASPKQQGPVVLSLGGNGVLSPPRKKQLKTEKAFVQFSSPSPPKPLFCRKARSSVAACAPVQPSKTPSSTKKVTFGLSRNTTAEFKKTDKSILVSPTGPSRVAFDPKQRPLHGVLKSPASSPASTALTTRKLLLATPHRRPRAVDFF